MRKDLNWLDVQIFLNANKIAPCYGYGYQSHEPFNPVNLIEMGILHVESGALHGPEAGLNLPSAGIGADSMLRLVVGNDDLKLRLTLLIFDSGSGEIASFTLEDERSHVHTLISVTKVGKEGGCLYAPVAPWVGDPEILPYPHIVTDAVLSEKAYPLRPDEFPVSDKAVDAACPEKDHESHDKSDPLFLIGIAALGQHFENQGKGDPLVCDGQHEHIDVGVTEFPVCAVQRQHNVGLMGQQGEYESGNGVGTKCALCEKTLDSPMAGEMVPVPVEGSREFVEAYCLHNQKCPDQKCHGLDFCHMYIALEKILEYSDNVIKFVVSLMHSILCEVRSHYKVTRYRGLFLYYIC